VFLALTEDRSFTTLNPFRDYHCCSILFCWNVTGRSGSTALYSGAVSWTRKRTSS